MTPYYSKTLVTIGPFLSLLIDAFAGRTKSALQQAVFTLQQMENGVISPKSELSHYVCWTIHVMAQFFLYYGYNDQFKRSCHLLQILSYSFPIAKDCLDILGCFSGKKSLSQTNSSLPLLYHRFFPVIADQAVSYSKSALLAQRNNNTTTHSTSPPHLQPHTSPPASTISFPQHLYNETEHHHQYQQQYTGSHFGPCPPFDNTLMLGDEDIDLNIFNNGPPLL